MFWSVTYKVCNEWREEMFENVNDMREWCEKRGLLNGKRKVEFRRKVDNCWALVNPEGFWE